jgi:hypothetical protein
MDFMKSKAFFVFFLPALALSTTNIMSASWRDPHAATIQ